MNILFIHRNFPGQFRHLAPALAADPANHVVALAMRKSAVRTWQGVRIVVYRPDRYSSQGIHAWAADFETKVIRGEACLRAARRLKAEGFIPDVIVCHPGWGESLFVTDVWPQARLGMYCEFFYQAQGADMGFDPEFAALDADSASRLRLKNVNNLLHVEVAHSGLAPTHWQASTFPQRFRPRITVVHDGIQTKAIRPNPAVNVRLKTPTGTISLSRADEVVTFVNRNLEPYRGYHTFMRALPEILAARPKARILIVGGNGVSYGAAPGPGRHWKNVFADEVGPRIPADDWKRVHFLGNVPYREFISLLQLSTVHVYLTYPFVLSWSLLEAMSAGCAVVGSDTAPVREVITHGETGVLTSFFDPSAIAARVCELLNSPTERARLGANARALVQTRYDLESICLPRQLAWVRALRTPDEEPTRDLRTMTTRMKQTAASLGVEA